MDKRALFLFVFIFTLISTLAVSVISLYMEHSWLDTVLYALATMWVVGIASQLLVHFLYLSILRPIEEQKFKHKVEKDLKHNIPLDEVERIDDVKAGGSYEPIREEKKTKSAISVNEREKKQEKESAKT